MKPDDFSDERGDSWRLVHAASHEVLAERPDPRVRATVLAAAAKAVEVGPRRPGQSAFAPRRWPWSLAAVLIVSVATALVITRAPHDDPARVLEAGDRAPSAGVDATSLAATAAVPAVAPPVAEAGTARVAEPRAKNSKPRSSSAATSSTPSPRAKASRRAPLEAEIAASDRRAVSIEEAKRAIPDQGEDAPSRAARREAAVPFPLSATAVPRAEDAPSGMLGVPPAAPAAPGVDSVRTRDARSHLVAPVARSEVDNAKAAPHGRVGIEPVSPEAWVARIVAMRVAGHDDAADDELEALQKRYPAFEIPRSALRVRREH